MVHAQQPTCTNTRIRSTQDTHKIFYAVQKGLLNMVTRRLDADERLALRSGCVYAWEERGPHSEITGLGIERFTEGRRWTPSRVRDEFLFYYERYMPTPDGNSSQGGPHTEAKPPRDWEPMVKQTYSVWVDTENGRRKWHLTAYFTQGTIDHLGTVDDVPDLSDLVVPEGLFKSTRIAGKTRAKTDEARSESSKTVTRTYAAFPSPYSTKPPNYGNSKPVLMHEPYPNAGTSNHGQRQDIQPPPVDTNSRHSRSPQRHSPSSLSPATPVARSQYPSDRAASQTYGDKLNLSHPPVPGPPGHESDSHQLMHRPLHPPLQTGKNSVNDPGHIATFVPPNGRWSGDNSMTNPLYAYQGLNHFEHDGDVTQPTGYALPVHPDQAAIHPAAPQSYRQQMNGYVPYDDRTGHSQAIPTPAIDVPLYELSPDTHMNTLEQSSPRPFIALAPLNSLNRQHPYKRNHIDDKALRMIQAASVAPPLNSCVLNASTLRQRSILLKQH
ncbi:hypothetical protein FA15DRAFT_668735 [Coprinopsis marcescibilis]|uniref:cAMP-independent regulatory protein pac2 n=1 Tax=Coprinopsis marcescibilis TaxID=230819 RepID=A0A5C3KWZ5_COPMA|nr:hypothetical protein FA15DRAFT_668735 [Coprinopsis marcescibilis]